MGDEDGTTGDRALRPSLASEGSADDQVVLGIAVEVAGGERGAELGSRASMLAAAGGYLVDALVAFRAQTVTRSVEDPHRATVVVLRRADREMDERVAVEIPRGDCPPEPLARLGRGGSRSKENGWRARRETFRAVAAVAHGHGPARDAVHGSYGARWRDRRRRRR